MIKFIEKDESDADKTQAAEMELPPDFTGDRRADRGLNPGG